MVRLGEEKLNGNLKAGTLEDTEKLMAQAFQLLAARGVNATDDAEVGTLIREMLEKRRDEWLKRVHNQKDHQLAYKAEGGSTVGLLEQPSENDWAMFTCLSSLRDVEGTVNLVLDQRANGLHTD